MTTSQNKNPSSPILDAIDVVSSDTESSEEEKPVIQPIPSSHHAQYCKICKTNLLSKPDHLGTWLCSICYPTFLSPQSHSKQLHVESKSESEQHSVLMRPREPHHDPDVDWEAHFGPLNVCVLKYNSLFINTTFSHFLETDSVKNATLVGKNTNLINHGC